MGKIIRNVYAFIKGMFVKLVHPSTIKGKVRIFRGASVRIYKGCKLQISDKVKIDENAVIAVQKNAILTIGEHVGIGPNDYVVCHKKISIGEGTILGPSVYIYDHDHIFTPEKGVDIHNYKCEEVIIGNNCWIGANTVILKGTHIGDNCVVAAGSVIKGNYSSGSVIIQKREIEVRNIKDRS